MSEYVNLCSMATELGLSSKSVIMSICVFLGIEIHKIPRNCLQYTYAISKADSNKIYDFIKLHPDKKERTDFLRNQGRIRNFGSWENWKESMCKNYKKSMLEKYGVENSMYLSSAKEKLKQTNIKKYGAENVFASEHGKQKIKETMLKKYGVENPSHLEYTKEKDKQTCLKKYGVTHYSQTKEFQSQRYKHFCYDGVFFDSSWELAVWVYCKDHDIAIEREPCSFDYEYEGKQHTYFPDFKINGKLVEVKGEHLLKMLKNSKENVNAAKYSCMCKNNIEIWTKKEVQLYLDYVDQKYGCEIYDSAAILKDNINKYVTSSFISKAKDLFGDTYDYSEVQCSSSNDKVSILCPKHGKFVISALHHLEGQGCPKCTKPGNKSLTLEQKNTRNRHIKLAIECGMAVADAAVLFGLSSSLIKKYTKRKITEYEKGIDK